MAEPSPPVSSSIDHDPHHAGNANTSKQAASSPFQRRSSRPPDLYTSGPALRGTGGHLFHLLVHSLKDYSLSKVLVEFYPFAGRIAEVRCDDSGVFFTKVVVEYEFEALGGHDALAEFLAGMKTAKLKQEGFNLYSVQEYDEIPPLVIQVPHCSFSKP